MCMCSISGCRCVHLYKTIFSLATAPARRSVLIARADTAPSCRSSVCSVCCLIGVLGCILWCLYRCTPHSPRSPFSNGVPAYLYSLPVLFHVYFYYAHIHPLNTHSPDCTEPSNIRAAYCPPNANARGGTPLSYTCIYHICYIHTCDSAKHAHMPNK